MVPSEAPVTSGCRKAGYKFNKQEEVRELVTRQGREAEESSREGEEQREK